MRHKYAALAAILVAGCAAPVPKAVELTRPVPAVTPAKVQVSFTRFVMSTDQVEGDAGVAGRQVTIDDPVRVASISKLIVALAVMRLVDDGKVNLDRDVGEYLGWPIRNPAFPATPITLRQLMSHRAGLRDEIDYILPLDGDLAQILSDPRAWDRLHGPGTFFQYANINSPLIAATIEGATGERFDRLMSRLVLEPLGLDACFNWATGCSSNRRAQAVTLLRPNGVLAKDPRLLDNQECGVQPAGDGSCDIEK
ncbi:MAG: serine hydrolase domain-containing protein, partial [Sphingorhabdus sp.]